ncbi:MAG: glycosidase [Elusimicrobiaceae bacterium]|nr:glycosidase [Elusimicrobiaceae bacterium]
MRTNPHILEINTYSWLKNLSKKLEKECTLLDVPDEKWEKIKYLGFDAVWLMGVWKKSAKSKQIAQEDKQINDAIKEVYPEYTQEDISASPYSVYDYQVDSYFGGDEAMRELRKKLNNMGLKLILDFVGNHMAVDSIQVKENPDYFVNLKHPPKNWQKKLFFKTENDTYIAHGKDPHFEPWTDTAQLNYFNPDTRKFMQNTLLKIASMCDGVRCDMVMLNFNDIHQKTWGDVIAEGGYKKPETEFWQEAIKIVKEQYPTFTFIAEVYWNLEWQAQKLGFDYTYDKILYDRLLKSTAQDIKGHLNAEDLYQQRSIRFIENHDEEAALTAFGREKSLAAALIISSLRGARLYHILQIYGRQKRVPIQYTGDKGKKDLPILRKYEKILQITNHPAFHGGQWFIMDTFPVQEGDEKHKNFLAWSWVQQNTSKMVVINYSSQKAECVLQCKKCPDEQDGMYVLYEEISGKDVHIPAASMDKGLKLSFEPYQMYILNYNF